MGAFPVKPATFALITAAEGIWRTADKICDKAKDITFDLTHEVIQFERARIAACSLPGIKASDKRMMEYIKEMNTVPIWLKLGDFWRGKGHKPLSYEPDSTW